MDDFKRCVVIEALAGAGKTYKLSHRYLELIQKGANPQSILATTFSRKAAGEIRDKIIEAAANAVICDDQRKELCDGIADLKNMTTAQQQEACASLLRQIISNLHLLQIGTIDSFFVKTAKAFGEELGFPPQWSILDELQIQNVLQEAVAKMLMSQKPEDIANAIRLANDSSIVPVLDTIHKLQKSVYGLFRQTDESAWNWGTPLPVLPHGILNEAIEHLATQKTEIKRHMSSLPKTIDFAKVGDWRKFLKSGVPSKVFDESCMYYGKEIDIHIVDAVQPIVKHASAVILNKILAKKESVYSLMSLFNDSWTKVKHEKGLYLFDDITFYLSSICIFNDLHELAFRLDSTTDHLLIDEFQDTSIPQWKIMELLVDEIYQSQSDRSLFFVGDPKQSLYGFRGGEPHLLRNLPAKLGLEGPEHLPVSWRCSVPVLDLVNQMFEHAQSTQLLLDHSEEGIVEWKKSFFPHVSAKPEMLGYAAVCTTDVDEFHKSNLQLTVKKVAELVQAIHKENKDASIGILVRKNTNQQIQRIVHALRTLPTNPVEAAEHGGNPLTDSVPVTVILSAFLLADHPGDTASLFHVSTSPLAQTLGVSATWNRDDATNISTSIRRKLLTDGYANVVFDFAEPLYASASERDRYRLWQLVELAEEYSKHSTLRPSDFVEYVKKKQVADPATSKVQVMTVHASKGLGFDAVVVCDLQEPLWKNPEFLMLHEDRCKPPIQVSTCENEVFNSLIPRQDEMWEECKSEQVQEALSLLYVAMTRAKHALYLVIPPRLPSLNAKNPSASKSKAVDRFIRQALQLEEHLDPNTIVWESNNNDTNWLSELKSSVEDCALTTPSEISWGKTKNNLRGIASSSPSSLEGGGKIKIAERFVGGTNTAFDWGTVTHTWFEDIVWNDGLPDVETLVTSAPSIEAGRLGEEKLLEAANLCLVALQTPEVHDLLTKPDGNVRVYREQEFALRVEKGTAFAKVTMNERTDIRGSIDRFVVHVDESGNPVSAEVIDWKTDAFESDELGAKIEHYAPQLASYRFAASKLIGIDVEKISATLVFLSTGSVIDITDKASVLTP